MFLFRVCGLGWGRIVSRFCGIFNCIICGWGFWRYLIFRVNVPVDRNPAARVNRDRLDAAHTIADDGANTTLILGNLLATVIFADDTPFPAFAVNNRCRSFFCCPSRRQLVAGFF
ncbi:MAG: hypothetical protein B7Z71_03885 [Acidocella sp. 21-58-7]|nr:MAG: hypothetical protein B7Z71_03885 [Acidocella sp. 21-58-7]